LSIVFSLIGRTPSVISIDREFSVFRIVRSPAFEVNSRSASLFVRVEEFGHGFTPRKRFVSDHSFAGYGVLPLARGVRFPRFADLFGILLSKSLAAVPGQREVCPVGVRRVEL
jgi:hypothetical protein